jgi:nitrogen regulatory protein P-II 1
VKLIRGVVRPSKLDELKQALSSINVVAFTVAEVRDYAPENAHTMSFLGSLYDRNDLPRLEVTAVVDDDNVDTVIGLILRTARTQSREDGYLCVMPVEHRYTIHTGHRELS